MMNARLKEVRKSEKVNLSQREFGRRLGVQDTAISKLESGERNLTDQMILGICREFNVNEDWLRTGEGGEESMFNKTDDPAFESATKGLDDLSKKIVRAYLDLPLKKREGASAFIYALSRSVLDSDIDDVHTKIFEIIDKSNVSHSVGLDLSTKVTLAFTDVFPYVGVGNVDEGEGFVEHEDERDTWNKGLTEEEALALVRQRYAAAKKGGVSSTTLGKVGSA